MKTYFLKDRFVKNNFNLCWKIFFLKVVSAVKSITILFTPELEPYLISLISVENNSLLLKKIKELL